MVKEKTDSSQQPVPICLIADEALACHVLWLFQTHDVQDGGSHVGQSTVLYGGRVVVGHVDKGNGIQRMSGVGRAVGIDGIVGITVVGNDDSLVVIGLGSLNYFAHAIVNGMHSLGNGIIDACMTYHVTVGEVHNDEVVLLCTDGCHKFVLHFVGTHLGLQVVGGHLWGCYENTILILIGRFAATIEEECYMSIFLRLGSVQLFLTLL